MEWRNESPWVRLVQELAVPTDSNKKMITPTLNLRQSKKVASPKSKLRVFTAPTWDLHPKKSSSRPLR